MTCISPCAATGSLDINVSLPQAANGRFTEGISVSSLTEVGPTAAPPQSLDGKANAEIKRKFLKRCGRRFVRMLGQPKTI